MSNISINYSQVQSTTAQVSQDATAQVQVDISAAYQEIYNILSKSAGDGAERIKDHLKEEQLLCEKVAELYQKLSVLIKSASDEMKKHDVVKYATKVRKNSGGKLNE